MTSLSCLMRLYQYCCNGPQPRAADARSHVGTNPLRASLAGAATRCHCQHRAGNPRLVMAVG